MYKTKQLKTDSYESLLAECEKVGLAHEGKIITASHNHHLMLLPNLMKATGNMLKDEDGNEYPEMTKVDGYHANLKTKKQLGIEHLAVNVKTPLIKWSGK